MGRYGQELGNIAAQAVRHTNLLKKKCSNRTTKTVRHLRSATDSTCEAAEKAAEATREADKAVQNLAAFAGELSVCKGVDAQLQLLMSWFTPFALHFHNFCHAC